MEVELGSRVRIGERRGEVRFIGDTSFATGEWIGVALDLPEGKNDGSVNGVRYFEAAEMHGLFVKRVQVKLDSSAESQQSVAASSPSRAGAGAVSRTSPARTSKLEELREKRRVLAESRASGAASGSLGTNEALDEAPGSVASPGATQGAKAAPDSPASSVGSLGSAALSSTSALRPAAAGSRRSSVAGASRLPRPSLAARAAPAAAGSSRRDSSPARSESSFGGTKPATAASNAPASASAAAAAAKRVGSASGAAARRSTLGGAAAGVVVGSRRASTASSASSASAGSRSTRTSGLCATGSIGTGAAPGGSAASVASSKGGASDDGDAVAAAGDWEAALATSEAKVRLLESQLAEAQRVAAGPAPAGIPSPTRDAPAAASAHFPLSPVMEQLDASELERLRSELAAANEKAAAAEKRARDALEAAQPDGRELERVKALLAEAVANHEAAVERSAKAEERASALDAEVALLHRKQETVLEEERNWTAQAAKEKAAAATSVRRVAELEAQLLELQDAMEALALDNQQALIEKEELQEKVDELSLELETAQVDLEHARLLSADHEATAARLRSIVAAAAATGGAAAAAAGDGGGGSAPEVTVDLEALVAQNQQLKEALKRLHEASLADRGELARRARQMERDAAAAAKLNAEAESLRQWKEDKTAELQDLMEQVDQGNAFESMVESLTERNLELGDRVAELSTQVDDLEASLQLSEELEAQQLEEAKALQRELQSRDFALAKQEMTLAQAARREADLSATLDRFRSALDTLRAERDALAARAAEGGELVGRLRSRHTDLLAERQAAAAAATAARRAAVDVPLLRLAASVAEARAAAASALLPAAAAEEHMRAAGIALAAARLTCKARIAIRLLKVQVRQALAGAWEAATAGGEKAEISAEDAVAATKNEADPAGEAGAVMEAAEAARRCVREAGVLRALADVAAVAAGATALSCIPGGSGLPLDAALAAAAELAGPLGDAEAAVTDLLTALRDEGEAPEHVAASAAERMRAACASAHSCVVTVATAGHRGSSTDTQSDDGGSILWGSPAGQRMRAACLFESAIAAAVEAVANALLFAETPNVNGLAPEAKALHALYSDLSGIQKAAEVSSGAAAASVAAGAGANFVAVWVTGLQQIRLGADELAAASCEGAVAPERVAHLQEAARTLLAAAGPPPSPPNDEEFGPAALLAALAAPLPAAVDSPGLSTEDVEAAPGDLSAAAPVVAKAAALRASLMAAASALPQLEAMRSRMAATAAEVVGLRKELAVQRTHGEQAEGLWRVRTEEAEQGLAALREKAAELETAKEAMQQEVNLLNEALEAAQEESERYETEVRALRAAGDGGSATASPRTRRTSVESSRRTSTPGGGSSSGAGGLRAAAVGGAALASQNATAAAAAAELRDQLAICVARSAREDAARWRALACASAASAMRPLPQATPFAGSATLGTPEATSAAVNASLKELAELSGLLLHARAAARVVRIGSEPSASAAAAAPTSAARAWHLQRLEAARLHERASSVIERVSLALARAKGSAPPQPAFKEASGGGEEALAASPQGAAAAQVMLVARLRLGGGRNASTQRVTLQPQQFMRLQQSLYPGQ